MHDEKLPVFGTVKLALLWGVFVVRRHWLIILIFALPLVAISFAERVVVEQEQVASWHFGLLSLAQWVLLSLLSIVLALVTHNEVLRGPAGLNVQTLGWGAGRVVGYAVDSLVLMLFGALVIFPLIFAVMGVTSLLRQFAPPLAPDALIILLILGAWLAAVFVSLRLMLRLPSRALGQPIKWREAWRLGRGNSVRLLGIHAILFFAMVATAVVVMAIQYLASMLGFADLDGETLTVQSRVPIQGQWSFIANATVSLAGGSIFSVWTAVFALLGNVLILAELVFFFALWSLVYAELERIQDARTPQTVGSRFYFDPNEPPEDF
ncbi:hypothetical protein ABLE93_11015 [Xanthobacter sp. KR7-65]|uniref:hypothetical protein n=1 Tax=Xanthobacter sp. KR7-65 TaxID=3156612 RepID=UPI0032B3CFDE